MYMVLNSRNRDYYVCIWAYTPSPSLRTYLMEAPLLAIYVGGLYFAKTDSAKSENQYRNAVNRTLPNQESDKPYSAKSYSGIC